MTPPACPKPTLERTKLLGDAVVAHLRSIGATLGHCHVPGRQPHSGALNRRFFSDTGSWK